METSTPRIHSLPFLTLCIWDYYCEDVSVALLQVHMLVHSGQKDFACPLCSYVTYVTHNLKKHCLTKHKVCVQFFVVQFMWFFI